MKGFIRVTVPGGSALLRASDIGKVLSTSPTCSGPDAHALIFDRVGGDPSRTVIVSNTVDEVEHLLTLSEME